MNEINVYKRNCPLCNKEIVYKQNQNCRQAEKLNRKCKKCANNITNEDRKKKYSEWHKGKPTWSSINKEKFSEWMIKNNPFRGKKHTEESKEKLRIARLKQTQKLKLKSNKIPRMYNPIACKFIEELNKKFGWNLKHAENGGEEWIAGYSVDGYDKEKNIVFEYDESYNPHHHNIKLKIKDIERQKRIINKIKPLIFVRYDEKNDRLYNGETNEDFNTY